MTTQPEEQQEPSMEEILSSIRKIISDEATGEDEPEQGAGERATDGPLSIAKERAPDGLLLAEPGKDGDTDDGESAEEDGDDPDVLELTDVVHESSTVIGLDTALTPPEPFKPRAFEPQPFEPDPPAKPLWSKGPAARRAGRSAAKDEPDTNPDDSGAAKDDQVADPVDQTVSPINPGDGVDDPVVASADQDTSHGEPDAGTDDPVAEASQDDQKQASADQEASEPSARAWSFSPPSDDHPITPTAEIRNHDMANQETAVQTPKNGIDTLVSDQVAGAAAGAFAKLSQAVQRTPPELAIADDSGRTTEQFMEDMMRPMLREWLDQNLPSMVERIVQREIQKVVRRAED